MVPLNHVLDVEVESSALLVFTTPARMYRKSPTPADCLQIEPDVHQGILAPRHVFSRRSGKNGLL